MVLDAGELVGCGVGDAAGIGVEVAVVLFACNMEASQTCPSTLRRRWMRQREWPRRLTRPCSVAVTGWCSSKSASMVARNSEGLSSRMRVEVASIPNLSAFMRETALP